MSGSDDDRLDVFPSRSSRGREESRLRFLNISHVKVDLAEWHRMQFEREEDALTGADFFRGSNDPFVPTQAHADGVVLQLSAAFDAFACAIAHHGSIGNPDRASFDGWTQRLVAIAGADLGERITEVRHGAEYRGLLVYRHLAAHPGVVGETIRGRQREQGEARAEVLLMLGDLLPPDAPPDRPRSAVRPILLRYVNWGRRTIDSLREGAVASWGLADGVDVIPPASGNA